MADRLEGQSAAEVLARMTTLLQAAKRHSSGLIAPPTSWPGYQRKGGIPTFFAQLSSPTPAMPVPTLEIHRDHRAPPILQDLTSGEARFLAAVLNHGADELDRYEQELAENADEEADDEG